MFDLARADVVLALKRFKRLAKQDLLASALTENPDFWRAHAEARREKYAELMEVTEAQGVEEAYNRAMSGYLSLPLFDRPGRVQPHILGQEQALEMFFSLLGVDPDLIERARQERPRLDEGELNGELAVNATS